MTSKLLKLAAALAFLGIAGVAWATSYNLACDWKSVFIRGPGVPQRVGYVTELAGLGLPALARDLTVAMPYKSTTALSYQPVTPAKGEVRAVGILESFSWAGGVGDPICLSMYVSQDNATFLRTARPSKSTSIQKLGFWVGKYEEETKQWFEQAHPAAPAILNAQLNAHGAVDTRLHIADVGTKISPNNDVSLYQVYLEIVPAPNMVQQVMMAQSRTSKVVLDWGLKMGK